MNRIKDQNAGQNAALRNKRKNEAAADTENQAVIDGYDYLGNSSSATDCTGLIPSAPGSRAERESYEDVYHYQPKPAGKD